MGQFKPMVKMETTEPSVILKLKKGGHVAKKAYGGAMPMPSTMPATMRPRMPARGGVLPAASPMAPSMMERRRAMAAPMLMSKKGGKAKHDDAAQDRAMIKKAMAGKKFASGGKIDAVMDKTTIKGNAGKFLNTKVVDGDKTDKAKGTGKVKMGAAGYKTGGTIEGNAGKFLNTKVVDGDKTNTAKGTGKVKMGAAGYKTGGTINGNEMKFAMNNVDTAKPGVTNTTTGGVKNGNGGGYKKGGAAKKHFATGGSVETGRAVAMPRKPVSKPVSNTMQSGTFKKGGKVAHKADGGRMPLKGHAYHDKSDDELKYILKDASEAARAMKNHSPKSESKYLDQVNDAATVMHYRKNGVTKKAYGGSMDDQQMPMRDMSGGQYDKVVDNPQADQMGIANTIRNAPGDAMSAIMRLLGKRPTGNAGRGMVNPPMSRKSGGRAKC